MNSFHYGGYRPHTPVKMLFLLFWPEDMRKGILSGTAKLETTPAICIWGHAL